MMYQLIKQSSYDDFNRAVNNFMKDGWELYGETKIQNEAGIIFYYQAVVK
jgi:hypothetical protein